MEISKKITLSSMGLGKTVIRAAVDGETGPVSLARILGKSTAAEPKQTDFGESIKLKGTFQGTNLLTGETFTSAVAYIPDFIADPLAEALKETDSVEFAIEIFAKASTKSPVGYEYGVRSLLETRPANAILDLIARVDERAALPAPTPIEQGKKKKAA